MKLYLPAFSLKILPELTFLLLLFLFPLFGFLIYRGAGMEPIFALGLFCIVFIAYRCICIWKNNEQIMLPHYLTIYGIFMVYAVVSNIIVDPQAFLDEGLIKVLYSNSILLTFYGLFIVENTVFPRYWLNIGLKILGVSLLLAAVVSVIQIKDPLFFGRNIYIKGLNFEQLAEYYSSHGYESNARIRRFLTGYRNSIFSYINLASVGIDGIAIFSLLIAIKTKNRFHILFFVILSGLVSFLSSSRWIMLNFLVVASQGVWSSKNKVSGILQFIVYSLGILILLSISLYAIGFDIEGFIENRLMSKSADTRFLAFEVFNRVFPENPIFGTSGTDTELMIELLGGQSSQIHVGYLKLFYYYGLIGGILYLFFLGSLLIRLWKMAKASSYWGGFFALFAFAMVNLTLFELSLFYYGLMLAIIFANQFYREEQLKVKIAKNNQANKKAQ